MLNSSEEFGSSVRKSKILLVAMSLFVGFIVAAGAAPSALESAHGTGGAPIERGRAVTGEDEGPSGSPSAGSQLTRGDSPVGVLSSLSPLASHTGRIDYVARGAAMRNQGYGNISVTWTGNLVAAYLVWGLIDTVAPDSGTVNGVRITGIVSDSTPINPCWVDNTPIHTLVADVTAVVVNGVNTLTEFPSGVTSGADPWAPPKDLPLLQGASLIVIHESGGPMREVSVRLAANTIEGPGSLRDTVVHLPTRSASAKTTFVVSDGQLTGNKAIWNSDIVDPNAFRGADPRASSQVWAKGSLWDTRTYDVPVVIGAASESVAIETGSDGDCLTWHAQILRVDGEPNEPPTLVWSGEAGYEVDGLEPEIGTPGTTFSYRVAYRDADNDAPRQVVIVIEKPLRIRYLASPMSLVGWLGSPGDYAVGALYAYGATLPAGTDYWYRFSASDPWDYATGLPTIQIDAPDVIAVDDPPVAVADVSPTIAFLGVPMTFDGSSSYDDQGVVEYEWDFGDGVADGNPVTIHQYASRGTFLVTLTVWDATGQTGTDSRTVQIENRAPIARATATPPPIYRGQIVGLDATESEEPDGDPLTYSWRQVRGPDVTLAGADTPTALFVPTELETYEFELTVDDGFGGLGMTSIAVTPLNCNPVANAGPDRPAAAKNVPIGLDSTASSDPDGDPLTVNWTAPPGIALSDVNDPMPTFTATRSGAYMFLLRVEDGLGGNATDTVVVTVLNTPPVASVVAPPAASKYTLVKLDGSSSSDADGDSLIHRWARMSGPIVLLRGADSTTADFIPVVSGTYVFELTVDDGDVGGTDSARVAVTVRNTPPTAMITAPTQGGKNDFVSLDGSASSDPDGDPLTFAWVQERGWAIVLSSPDAAIATFTPARAGTYVFRLVVVDSEGAMGQSTVTVTVPNAPPVASLVANPPVVRVGRPVAFDATGSADVDGTIVAYAFDFGDGTRSTGTASTASHTYASSGTYAVILGVTDDDGGTDVVQRNASVVANMPPTPIAVVRPGEVGTLDTTFVFDGSNSTDDVAIVAYAWDLWDGAMATGPRVEHRYTAKGTYPIRLTVIDDEGTAASTILSVRIVNRPPVITASDPDASVVLPAGRSRWFAVTAVDPDADSLSYAWTIDGLEVAADGSSLDLAPSGTHRLNVTVSDGEFAAWHEWTVRVQVPQAATNWKPVVAGVFTTVLVLVGAWSARRAPWSRGCRRQFRAFAVTAMPFVVGETATGVLSFVTGFLSIPPVVGLGMAVDLAILLAGLAASVYRVRRWTLAQGV